MEQRQHRPPQHILACLSSSPSNAKIVQTAAEMARAFGGVFTALYVRTPADARLSEADKARLQAHIRLAEQEGAEIAEAYGEDVPDQIAEFARISGITKIVLGSASVRPRLGRRQPTLTERLTHTAPEVEIYIIPDAGPQARYRAGRSLFSQAVAPTPWDLVVTAALLAAVTAAGSLLQGWGVAQYNIIMLYMVGVLLTALCTKGYVCGVLGSVLSVAFFNFFFTTPELTFHAYDSGYQVTFGLMLTTAVVVSTLTTRLKTHAKLSARAAWRTNLLFDTSQLLQKGQSEAEILSLTARQLVKLLDRQVAAFPAQEGELGPGQSFGAQPGSPLLTDLPAERAAAEWAFAHRKRAGAFTGNGPEAKGMYLALRTAMGGVFGVVGVDLTSGPLEAFENSVLLSILGECALAMENCTNAREKEQAAIRAENEQLRANLLRAISHDLRTPLTAISGNASNLLTNDAVLDAAARRQICTDIWQDSQWLIGLVENLLAITRIEDGRMQLRLSPQLVEEVVEEALHHVGTHGAEQRVTAHYPDQVLLADMDARLIMQVVINLVDNALKYAPAPAHVEVTVRPEGQDVAVQVADNGPGIPDDGKDKVFEMFYTGPARVADSRRSLGLGLPLCKAIVNAHGGTLTLTDNTPHGCVFTFTLPQSKVDIHE